MHDLRPKNAAHLSYRRTNVRRHVFGHLGVQGRRCWSCRLVLRIPSREGTSVRRTHRADAWLLRMARRFETASCARPCNRVDRLRCITRSVFPAQLVLLSFRLPRPMALRMSLGLPLSLLGSETSAERATLLEEPVLSGKERRGEYDNYGRVETIGPNFGLLAPNGGSLRFPQLLPQAPRVSTTKCYDDALRSRHCCDVPVCTAAAAPKITGIHRHSCLCNELWLGSFSSGSVIGMVVTFSKIHLPSDKPVTFDLVYAAQWRYLNASEDRW